MYRADHLMLLQYNTIVNILNYIQMYSKNSKEAP